MSYNKKIMFPENTFFLGRNGTFKCSGVDIFIGSSGELFIEPITSKGQIGRATIVIHQDKIDEFAKSILELCKQK